MKLPPFPLLVRYGHTESPHHRKKKKKSFKKKVLTFIKVASAIGGLNGISVSPSHQPVKIPLIMFH